jgi:catechol 2,3-dioxygenase-like lactoylglutathione lyase family enzyme
MSRRPEDPDHLDQEMLELERELEQELAELPGSDRENVQRRPHLAYAILYCEDIEDLSEFYCAVFGFDRRYESGSTVELHAGSIILTIADEGQLIETCGLDRLPAPFEGRSSLSFLVEDVDGCCEAAVALGARIEKDPHDTDWGMRSCWLSDPAGHLIEIGRFAR